MKRRQASFPRHRNLGLSLIELMVSMVLLSVVVAGLFAGISVIGHAQASATAVNGAQSGVRAALEMMSRDIEMASAGAKTGTLNNSTGGTLTVSATARAGGVRLQVADTGPGIAPDVIDRLFDPWVTTKPAGQGSGLGLAIVRDVVRAHGGTVFAVNRSVGAAFTIDLPTAADPESERHS